MNHRRHPRLEIHHPCAVHYGGNRYTGLQILKVSAGGLFLQWGDSELSRRVPSGYWEASRRQQASVELQGTQLSVLVELVYVTQFGLGVAFSEPAQSLYAYLREYRQGASQSETATGLPARPDSAIPALLVQLRDKALAFQHKLYERFPELARDRLISATGEGLSSSVQADLFFAITILEQQGSEIRRQFFEGMQSCLLYTSDAADECPAV